MRFLETRFQKPQSQFREGSCPTWRPQTPKQTRRAIHCSSVATILAPGVKRTALRGALFYVTVAVAHVALRAKARIQIVQLHHERGCGVTRARGHVQREVVPETPRPHVSTRPEHSGRRAGKIDVLCSRKQRRPS